MKHKTKSILSIFAVCAAALTGHASAQEAFPSRTVRWVVPFAPGGPADMVARTITQQLTERWGQSVVVDNKPGANTVIAVTDVLRSKPDGYTLLQTIDSTLTMNQFIYSKAPYDPLKDFSHVTVLASLPLQVVTNAASPAKTMGELVALAKRSSTPLTYGFATPIVQVAMETLAKAAGIKFTAVPYKSTSDIVKAILGNELDVALDGGPPYLPHVQSGRVNVLAVTGERRSEIYPNVPTLREAGINVLPVTVWHGLSAPAGLPPQIRLKIEQDVREVLASKVVKDKLRSVGLNSLGTSQEDYLSLIRKDIERIGPAVAELGIKVN